MLNRLERLRRDERGMSLIYVVGGFIAFLCCATLAIDVGVFMTARSQAQNAADGGALAGAIALVRNSFTDHSATGPAVQSAINTAKKNFVIGNAPSVLSSDVSFPLDANGQSTRVKVWVYRNTTRGNPVATYLGPLFGVPTVNIGAVAMAEAAPANAETCVKPFTIPDRWVENIDPPWSTSDTFDRYYTSGPHKGEVITPTADIYYPADSSSYVGYNPIADKGLQLTIRAGTGANIEPTMYFSWNMPGGSGGDPYRDNIANCNTTIVHFGDNMEQEPGNMVGPTDQGVDDLIAKDPSAYWDTTTNMLHTTKSPSPRVAPLPLFDPDYYQSGVTQGRNATLKVANWVGFFIESRNGNEVTGRITPITGILDPNAGPAPNGTFPRVIRLVQ
jgi:Flp pilus assembly protein TadG